MRSNGSWKTKMTGCDRSFHKLLEALLRLNELLEVGT